MKSTQMDGLRKLGYKIRVTHFRVTLQGTFTKRWIDEQNAHIRAENARLRLTAAPSEPDRYQEYIIQPCGGRVEVEIEDRDGTRSVGIAHVSKKDNFKGKIGTQMAFGRAWKPFSFLGAMPASFYLGTYYPLGAQLAHKESKDIGTIKGCHLIQKSPGVTRAQYVIAWNAEPKTIHCVDVADLELVDPSSYGIPET